MINQEDIPLVDHRNWHCSDCGRAVSNHQLAPNKRTTVHLSRVLWEAHHGPIPEEMQVDHINMNPLDNRLENLRLATQAQNMANRRTWNALGLKGVFHEPQNSHRPYVARMTVNSKHIRLGAFATKEEASAAYAQAAKKAFGAFARIE